MFFKFEFLINMAQIFYELLRSILTYIELPHIFEKKVITLAIIQVYSIVQLLHSMRY